MDTKEIEFHEQLMKCKIGTNVSIKPSVILEGNVEKIEIGDNSIVGSYCNFRPVNHKIVIQKNVLIAQMVSIVPDSHCYQDVQKNIYDQDFYGGDIVIEDNVWIGCNSVILHNTRIGAGCVIAAGSVVRRNIPPYCVVAGNPAKIVKRYSFKLKRWMNYKNFFIRRFFKMGLI